jgi:methylated-DNA-protein-cysteine methyltransferase related protein
MDKETFFDKVYEVARLIPAGRVTSYGAIASYLGMKGSSRMVGYAMSACGEIYPPVPAHRVVNRNGLLTGKFHFPTLDLMEQMLESEGVKVDNDKVIDFKGVFWDPAEEME